MRVLEESGVLLCMRERGAGVLASKVGTERDPRNQGTVLRFEEENRWRGLIDWSHSRCPTHPGEFDRFVFGTGCRCQ